MLIYCLKIIFCLFLLNELFVKRYFDTKSQYFFYILCLICGYAI